MDLLGAEALCGVLRVPSVGLEVLFKGGFQISPRGMSRPAVRARLVAFFSREPQLAELLLSVPEGPWWSWFELLQVLDEDWLRVNWRDLVRYGGLCAAAALALDIRPGLWARGRRLLRREDYWAARTRGGSPVHSEPCSVLAELLFGEAPERVDPPSRGETVPGGSEEGGGGLKRQVVDLRRSLDNHRARLRTQKKALKQAEQDALEQHKRLQAEVRCAQARVHELEASLEARVAAGVAAVKRRLFGLDPALREAASETDRESGGLLVRFHDVLRRQRLLNEKAGVLSDLRRQIEELEQAARELRTCIDDSVTVLPQARDIHGELTRRIRTLRERLGTVVEENEQSDLSSHLRAWIKSVHLAPEGAADLDRAAHLLEDSMLVELLGSAEIDELRGLLEERRDLLRELQDKAPEDGRKHASGHAPGGRSWARELWDPTAELEARAGDPREVWLFVDGYNAIRRVSALREIEEKRGSAEARRELCALCRRKLPAFAHLEIVFDGAGPLSERDSSSGVVIAFSEHATADQNADRYLMARLSREQSPERRLWLVTDDFGLRGQVEDVCEAFISPVHFHQYLTRNGHRPRPVQEENS